MISEEADLPLCSLRLGVGFAFILAFSWRCFIFGFNGKEPIQTSLLFGIEELLQFFCTFPNTFLTTCFCQKAFAVEETCFNLLETLFCY